MLTRPARREQTRAMRPEGTPTSNTRLGTPCQPGALTDVYVMMMFITITDVYVKRHNITGALTF